MMAVLGATPSSISTNSTGRTGNSVSSVPKKYTAKLCFLMDVTGSMEPQRDAVVAKIMEILLESDRRFPNVAIQVAFVGYRDVDHGGAGRYVTLPFTSNYDQWIAELQKIPCTGGGDEAEDVLGGMQECLKLDWDARVKVVFHIGDSPHHGALFQEPGCNDDHSDLQEAPRPYSSILADFADRHIDYNFAVLQNKGGAVTTRKMTGLFESAYNSCQSKTKQFAVMDLSHGFSAATLFDKVLSGLTGSIRSFLKP